MRSASRCGNPSGATWVRKRMRRGRGKEEEEKEEKEEEEEEGQTRQIARTS